MANDISVGTGTGGTSGTNIGVNTNYGANEKSDFAVAELITWDRALTEDETETASTYLLSLLDGAISIPT